MSRSYRMHDAMGVRDPGTALAAVPENAGRRLVKSYPAAGYVAEREGDTLNVYYVGRLEDLQTNAEPPLTVPVAGGDKAPAPAAHQGDIQRMNNLHRKHYAGRGA
jgi:hypothetical protein